jgi:hypothetical protein
MKRKDFGELALALRKAFPLRWNMVRRYRLPQRVLGEPYYAYFEPGGGIFGESWNSFDSAGVLYKGEYNPVSIAQYGLYRYEDAYGGDAGARTAFFRQVEYLRTLVRPDGTIPFSFPLPDFELGPGWISGMLQGEACSLFLRAFALTADDAYLADARAVLEPLERSAEAGGATYMRGGDVFFEEVPGLPTHILNGHLWTAFGVWEACEYGFASQTLRELHAASIETLVRWLPLYDADGWSFYQLGSRGAKRRYVPITYHQTHINELRIYAAMTGRKEFGEMAERWRRGLDRTDVRVRVWRDSAERLAEAAARRIARVSPGPWRLHGITEHAS